MGKVSSTISFGLELECVKLSRNALDTISKHKFERHLDHSIKGDNGETLPRTWPGAGHEIVTPPQVVPVSMNGDGSRLAMEDKGVIETVSALASCSSHVNSSCGIHVHLGHPKHVVKDGVTKTISYWSPDEVRTMLIIGQILEPRLWKLVHKSRHNNDTCESISKRYSKNDMGQFYPVGKVDPVKYSNQKRYCWLNLIETARKGNRSDSGFGGSPSTGTIEIRMLGETDNSAYIYYWLQLWLKIASLVAYAPNTLAISNCCFSDVLESDFHKLATIHESDAKKRSGHWPSAQTLTPSVLTPSVRHEVEGASNVEPDITITSTHITPRVHRIGRIITSNTTTSITNIEPPF
jgi:hypothetical protein